MTRRVVEDVIDAAEPFYGSLRGDGYIAINSSVIKEVTLRYFGVCSRYLLVLGLFFAFGTAGCSTSKTATGESTALAFYPPSSA